MAEERVNLIPYAKDRAVFLDSMFRGTDSQCRLLIQFMDENQWFGCPHEVYGTDVVVENLILPSFRLDLWLTAFHRTDEEKYNLLLERVGQTQEPLAALWKKFQEAESLPIRTALDGLDFLLYENQQNKVSGREDFEHLLIQAESILPRKTAEVLIRFCSRHKDLFGIPLDDASAYRPAPSTVTRETRALPLSDFAHLAWCVFDEEAIQAGRYIEKASDSRMFAETWMMTGMHFVAAIRIPDIQALPVPDTRLKGLELRNSIRNGNLSIRERTEMVNNWLGRIELEGRMPNKTLGTPGVNPIEINVPTSLYPVFGTMLALAASYHEEGQPFLTLRYVTGDSLRRFFGEEFNKICGSHYFLSTRRLNKSYLQGTEYMAEHDGTVHVRGYLLSSLLRSHKMHYGTLSNTTDAYLRDGDFAGISPETAAAEMFERGIFGFIPVILLSHYSDSWHSLSLHEQTIVIRELTLSPVQIERLTAALESARRTVSELLAEVFSSEPSVHLPMQERIARMLSRIVSGEAPGTQFGCMCLRKAAGLPCSDVQRSCCLGCGYELWTRSGIHVLMEAYETNIRAMKTAGMAERIRLGKINSCHILPAIQGILYGIRIYGDSKAAQGLIEMIEWRMNHAKT